MFESVTKVTPWGRFYKTVGTEGYRTVEAELAGDAAPNTKNLIKDC